MSRLHVRCGHRTPKRWGGSRFTCHLQPSRQADLPQGEEEDVWGEGGHGSQKLVAWNLPLRQLSGGYPLASRWPLLWKKRAGGRHVSPTGHEGAHSEGPGLRWDKVGGNLGPRPGSITRSQKQSGSHRTAVCAGTEAVNREHAATNPQAHGEPRGTNTRQGGGGRRAGLEGQVVG